jgi:hypothetical protein
VSVLTNGSKLEVEPKDDIKGLKKMSEEKDAMEVIGSLDYRTAVVIGSYIGELKNKVERYEKALKEINDFEGMTLYEAQSIAQEALKV